jgi:deoxyribose-phosphate aldolase
MGIASYLDHTLLKAQSTLKEIDMLCDEARRLNVAAVCINPVNVERAAARLKGSRVKVATVVGFPLGATLSSVKAREAHDAIVLGAQEIDMVIAIGPFLSGEVKIVARDIREVVLAAGALPVKVIIETCYLSPKQIAQASLIACDEGAAFVKTSTGFGTRGATVDDVRLIRAAVGERCLIKASGGIRTYAQAMAMIDAGAARIGTSSSADIVAEEKK